MVKPRGTRLREDQEAKANRYLDKSPYDYADYIRAAVDHFQSLPAKVIDEKVKETWVLGRNQAKDS